MTVLDNRWRRCFFLASLAARLPLSMIPVIVLLEGLDSGVSIAQVGLVLGALAFGTALTGIIQGPAWDRFNQARLYLVLSALGATTLSALSLVPLDQALAVVVGFLAGLSRPQTTIVTRAAWLEQFANEPENASRSVALDVSAIPVLGVLGPLLAGALFAWLGPSALIAVALIGLGASLGFSALLISLPRPENRASVWRSARQLLANRSLTIILALALITTSASGSVAVLLAARLSEVGVTGWLSPLLAISAAAIIAGAALVRLRPQRLDLILAGEAGGFLLYAFSFTLRPDYLWIAIPLGSLFVAPLITALFLLVEQRVEPANRRAALALLASSQLFGAALGQIIFSAGAEMIGAALATAVASAVIATALTAWLLLPQGAKLARAQDKVRP